MDYNEKLNAIDERIKRDYERLVAERYLPVFSEVVSEKGVLLRDNKIDFVELNNFPGALLIFFDDGHLCQGKREIFPTDTDERRLYGLLEIAKIYQRTDYHISVQTALKTFLDNLELKVREAVMRENR